MANPAYTTGAYTESPITGTTLSTLSSDSVRKLWKKGVDTFEETNDFFAEMEGSDPMSIIQTETDTSKGAGQSIFFTNRSGLYGEAHMGEERFTDSKHYEELLIGSNTLAVDWFRHGVEYTERSEEYMGMRGELVAGLPQALGEWGGRLKTEKVFMTWRDKINSENMISVSGGLTWNEVVKNAQMMKRWGASSAMVGRDPNGKPLRRYCVIACTDALTSLKLDSDYRDLLKTTRNEQGAKYIFSGGFADIDGHVIKEYEAIEHDGYGAIGSPMNPMGRLGVARTSITTNAADYVVLGGADYARDTTNNTLIKPAKWFPEFAYKYNVGDTATPAGTAFYIAIINPPNAATDPNKYGLYEVGTGADGSLTANNGVRLALKNGLASSATSASGAGCAKVINSSSFTGAGSLAFNSTYHTNNHPVGALVVLVDVNAVPLFHSFIVGAASTRRGYGKYRNNRTFQNKEGNFVRDVYFNTVMGTALRTNRLGRAPGVLRMTHQGIYAGTPLPTP